MLVKATRVIAFLAAGLAFLAISLPASAASSDHDIIGVWASEELGFELEIYDCGKANLCGRVVSYSRSSDYVEVPMPPPRKVVAGDQRIVGRELLTGFEADQEDGAKWNNGRIFNPKDGRTYKSTLTLADEDTLKVRAYVATPILGRNLILKRIPQYGPARSDWFPL